MSAPGGPSGRPHKTGSIARAATKTEAKEKAADLPSVLQPSWKRFVDKTSNAYKDYSASHDGSGGYRFKTTKPGNVPGSRAEYFKEVDAFGKTTASYKITYDNKGNFVHRKEKM